MRNYGRKIKKILIEKFRADESREVGIYESPKRKILTKKELSSISVDNEIWKHGDTLYKYSKKYYGNEKYWWVIAWFNRRTTESHFKVGDVISIPDLSIVDYYSS